MNIRKLFLIIISRIIQGFGMGTSVFSAGLAIALLYFMDESIKYLWAACCLFGIAGWYYIYNFAVKKIYDDDIYNKD